MTDKKVLTYIEDLIETIPKDWLNLTTHRLDIYDESLAKTEFLDQLETLFQKDDSSTSSLGSLPTAYDYIRLGHPLSCVLEWGIAKLNRLPAKNIISFSSQSIPVFSILRKNLLEKKKTQIIYCGSLPDYLDFDLMERVYQYSFELKQIEHIEDVPSFEGSTIFIAQADEMGPVELNPRIDFYLQVHSFLGSVLVVNGVKNETYISEIQHVRRRETISMTPANCLSALHLLLGHSIPAQDLTAVAAHKASVRETIKSITNTSTKALISSSGLSIQYAIMMGLIDEAQEKHPGKDIQFIVPPNCYGGTNDQARRVAACIKNVEVLDLPVDGDNDMVQSIDRVLEKVAGQDAVAYIIVEIPTNPRVEVPDLIKLQETLAKSRYTANGQKAIEPVFILDQTFCPNVQFAGIKDRLSVIKTISYVSGSKFPSGGKCTAGYCVANDKAASLMENIEKHLKLCDNEATDLQLEILAKQLPSMLQRIKDAYNNTREYVNFIKETLPSAKINFVSEELAEEGFTPSVFSLDLPTKGNTPEEQEAYKRELNLKLITKMITEIPHESKYCVSYGQLKGCYWTIPATSTQGTTKEGDKDYIARVALSANMDLELHKKVFKDFVDGL